MPCGRFSGHLLQADVNVKLVMQLSNTIKERALNEKPPRA